jgi:SAM-dependent methyltransferase
VIGLEYDLAATAIAAGRCTAVYPVDLDAPGALQPAFAHAPYDVVLAAAVLEHLKHPQTLLCNLRALLNPGGLLIVSLPNIAHWRVRLRLLRGRFDYEDYGIMDRTHLHFYTLSTGRALIESQGYAVETVHIAGSALQNGLNALARRLGMPQPPLILPGLLGYELIYMARYQP